ncbi:MAG: hypothetical protein FWC95_04225 [Defluviitaleaceae bacterium]|nr:hypothetical protein [Defluviitaleaceae bacterium]
MMLTINTFTERTEFLEAFNNRLFSSGIFNLFGYSTGALYALLLDEIGADWRYNISWNTNLSAILKEAAGITELVPFNEINLERYGYTEIRNIEEAYASEIKRLKTLAVEAFSGPILFLPWGG